MNDGLWMQAAIGEARLALGRTAPNPSVGAVLVRDGRVLGKGRTQPVGGPHAEVEAIRDARERGEDLAGATLYVTLEPCCHWGRTPPCTDAILRERIRRVVVGVVDPFGPMQGKGLARLRDAGVEVDLGVEAADCARLVTGFTRTILHGLPEVTLKVAASADGHLATATGESQWITGDQARADVHHLRANHDAVLVGLGTVLADNPRLTSRVPDGKDPVPVVLDTELRVPDDARLFTSSRRAILICATDAPARDLPATVVRVPRGPGGVDLDAAFRALAAAGLHRVLVEGGGRVARSAVSDGLVDTLHLYVGSLLIPGGLPWLAGPPVATLADATRLDGPPEVALFGTDVRLTWRLRHRTDRLASNPPTS